MTLKARRPTDLCEHCGLEPFQAEHYRPSDRGIERICLTCLQAYHRIRFVGGLNAELLSVLERLDHRLSNLEVNVEKIMSDQETLNQKVQELSDQNTQLQSTVDTTQAAVATHLQKNADDLAAAATEIQSLKDQLAAAGSPVPLDFSGLDTVLASMKAANDDLAATAT